MRKLVAAGLVAAVSLFWIGLANAQSISPVILPGGCGTANYYAGTGYLTVDSTGTLCTSAGSGSASNPSYVKSGQYSSAGAGQYAKALSTSSVGTLTVPSGATIAQICVETAAARYTDDGTTPTTAIGIPIAAGGCFQYSGPLASLQFIAQAAGATLDVSYYK